MKSIMLEDRNSDSFMLLFSWMELEGSTYEKKEIKLEKDFMS